VYFCASIADVAQLVEQLICNQHVGGSSPFIGSRKKQMSDFRIQNTDKYKSLVSVIWTLCSEQERYPSGQRGRAVNPLAPPTEVRILPSPPW
jgi:hypothetical protein